MCHPDFKTSIFKNLLGFFYLYLCKLCLYLQISSKINVILRIYEIRSRITKKIEFTNKII